MTYEIAKNTFFGTFFGAKFFSRVGVWQVTQILGREGSLFKFAELVAGLLRCGG